MVMNNGVELENSDDIKYENKCNNKKPREYEGIVYLTIRALLAPRYNTIFTQGPEGPFCAPITIPFLCKGLKGPSVSQKKPADSPAMFQVMFKRCENKCGNVIKVK